LARVLMGRLMSPPYMGKRASGATIAFFELYRHSGARRQARARNL
jgi:hypothetical protein